MAPELLALQILILLFSVIVHEVMHGWVALKFGDRTAENAGRLTLNPIPHIDPFGTVLLPAILFISGSPFLFAWAKPVPVNPLNFTELRKGELFVSAAGVVSNFCLAIVAAILFHIMNIFSVHPLIGMALLFAVKINLILGIFNLIPIPPLDGSKILMSQLSYKLAQEYSKIEPFGIFIIFALVYLNVLSVIWAITLPPLYALLGIPL